MRQKHGKFTPEGHEILVFRRGKHKVYVDMVTLQIIAINPKSPRKKGSLGKIASMASLGATIGSVVPGLGTGIGGALGAGLGVVESFVGGGSKEEKSKVPSEKHMYDSLDKPNRSERVINKELYGV
jgi:hypothetical protein